MPDEPKVPYAGLTPDRILDAVESLGLRCDGRLLALNSYENRVYEIGLDEAPPVVVKFYRPGRWTDEAIAEEHAFTRELADHEIPVVAPSAGPDGRTLHRFEGFRFAVFPKRAGRTPELEDPDTLRWMGRFMGRIHAVGAVQPFAHRPALDVDTFGEAPFRYLVEHGVLPPHLETPYRSLVEDLLVRIRRCYERAGRPARGGGIRLHGDCHPGNLLWTGDGPLFVDFDDCRSGPAVQDLWMLLSGDRDAMRTQLGHVLEGYTGFCSFDPRELHLVEALRTLRMIHHSGWLAKRWGDPAFPASFPWFAHPRYWEDQVLALREQAALLDEPPLEIDPYR